MYAAPAMYDNSRDDDQYDDDDEDEYIAPPPPQPPSLAEMMELTRSELTKRKRGGSSRPDTDTADSHDDYDGQGEAAAANDTIQECGRAALDLLARDPGLCMELAYQQLHAVPYREVRACWRRLYVDAALRVVLGIVGRVLAGKEEDGKEMDEDWVTEVVRVLDMALILTGGPAREELIELWFSALEAVLDERIKRKSNAHQETETPTSKFKDHHHHDGSPPPKKRKLNTTSPKTIPATFPTTPSQPLHIKHPIPVAPTPPSLSAFQAKLANPTTQTPLIIRGAIDHWPALHSRPWSSPQYLLGRTLGGRRLVPVEIGRSYTDDGWGQRIMRFGEFLEGFMFDGCDNDDDENEEEGEKDLQSQPNSTSSSSSPSSATNPTPHTPTTPKKKTKKANPNPKNQTTYLAQHDLLTQIPLLKSDLTISDYCYASTSSPSPSPSSSTPPPKPPPQIQTNLYLGPPSTITPLHTDPHPNILAQVFGRKYIRLYAPSQTARLYPRGVEEGGVDMRNTSRVDLEVAMRVWGEVSCYHHHHHHHHGDSDMPDEKDEDKDKDDKKCQNQNCGQQQQQQSHEEEEEEEEEAQEKELHTSYKQTFPLFPTAPYMEAILEPGECLYLPRGWWHYVRSLTPSCSVSFWF